MRNSSGQFTKGNSGRPKGSVNKASNYRRALQEAMDEDDILDLIETLKHKAKEEKDLNSIKTLLEYTLGKPTQMILSKSLDQNNSLLDLYSLPEKNFEQ